MTDFSPTDMQHLFTALEGLKLEQLRYLRAQNCFLAANKTALEGHDFLAPRFAHFEEVVKPEYASPDQYLSSRLFIMFVSNFEIFLQDIATCIMRCYPKKLGSAQFRLADILDASGNEELISRAIEECLNKLMYKRPMEYLSDYCNLLSLDRKPLDKYWPTFVEAKARRDLGVHANWRCNSVYLRKVAEAGVESKFKIGDFTAPSSGGYFDDVSRQLFLLGEALLEQVACTYKTIPDPSKALQL